MTTSNAGELVTIQAAFAWVEANDPDPAVRQYARFLQRLSTATPGEVAKLITAVKNASLTSRQRMDALIALLAKSME